ncbi:PREDICTED: uncharacterized protein LOC106124623 [Papilio xuthus]|uniref:Uncharacterized protein LOC106124623 n=1 Tax=Papilio xuthus TaxID=66420 RepID=A0A194PNA3_PAPXU|nr:PREDICTED: uncharacterized protein LOC106124623 [Papilio xuthus]KPI94797.1 hypothetical protein RR46_11801 [Papilio xuthus]
MGSNTSKSISETAVHEQKNDLDTNTNPDPRSPTPEITRTPLQNKNNSKHNITKNVDLRKTFENGQVDEKLIHNNPILTAVIKNHLQSYDPRSPTQDFERTPIVIPTFDESGIKKKTSRLQNNNSYASPCLKKDPNDDFDTSDSTIKLSPDLVVAKNLCDGFYDLSLNETLDENEQPLGSSTTSNKCIEDKLSPDGIEQPKVLLETNFDYVDLKNDIIEESKELIYTNGDIEEPEVKLKKNHCFKILKNDPRSPSVDIKRTPIVVTMTDGNDSKDNVEEMSDDTLIRVLQSTSEQTHIGANNVDGVLIYEDESAVITTPKKRPIHSLGSRTPLSCMKNTTDASHTRSKSANNLEKKKELTKTASHMKYVSHIPRLKSLSKQMTSGSSVSLKNTSKSSSISGDCENTPPHSHRDRWDKDNSIVL